MISKKKINNRSRNKFSNKIKVKSKKNNYITNSGILQKKLKTVTKDSNKNITSYTYDLIYTAFENTTVGNPAIYDITNRAKAIITRVVAVVETDSNLATHEVNIQMSATSGTAADSSISSGTELLGAGVTNTDSTDSTSAEDIDMGSGNDGKEVWICRDTVINGASDQFIYVCNAGTGNGTTNSATGTLSIIIEYYGVD